jgi:hypothetical protein
MYDFSSIDKLLHAAIAGDCLTGRIALTAVPNATNTVADLVRMLCMLFSPPCCAGKDLMHWLLRPTRPKQWLILLAYCACYICLCCAGKDLIQNHLTFSLY